MRVEGRKGGGSCRSLNPHPSTLNRPEALLIDATTYLFRAYFARRSLISRDGSQVNAVYGFMETLVSLLEERRPEYAAAAFDDPMTPTFRQTRYPGYKQRREPTPERLLPQYDLAREASRALGILPLQSPGDEADDLLATLVRRLRGRGVACLLVGADKDLAQLVGAGVWLYPFGQSEPMDAAAVREKYGVPPERIPDLLALAGDAADSLPGVAGVGERLARRLLSVDVPGDGRWENSAALAELPPVDAARLREALRQGREAFRMGRELATLRDDVALPILEDELAYRGPEVAAVTAYCDRLGFDRLRDRILAFAASFGEPDGEAQRRGKGGE